MQRATTYSMSYAPSTASAPKYGSSHNTSSAFSASANANEDWTKISDLAERRRIQNRIAQRNYRKKIKRRLEDLEKRATSSSPEQTQRELALPSRVNDTNKRRKSKPDAYSQVRQRTPESSHNNTPYLTPSLKSDFSPDYGREISLSPPPTFAPSYSLAPDANVSAGYYEQPPSTILPAPYAEYPAAQYSLPPLQSSLPSMSPYDSAKPAGLYEGEDMLPQYAMGGYAPYPSVELPMNQSYPDSNAHTPPLSQSHSFDQSRDGSPLVFPTTPISRSESPKFLFR